MEGSLPELLAPAGGPAEFNAALAAGADAIYCGFGSTFNARRGAESFSSGTFKDACRKAHLAGVRVYVTVNVAIRDEEMPVVLALVRRVWLLGADAVIIQDWGLLSQITKRWPDIECHVSTQANVHDARATRWCGELGVARVTLSRELSLAEIETIAHTGVELECFCHGAICICYSGICHMSSCAGNRSANRGACAQPCRLPYELVDEQGRVLSTPERGRPLCPKDYYSFDLLERLISTGVRSLKVEGRLKGPDYLVSVIGAYREQLDDFRAGVKPSSDQLQKRRTRLKRAFNRDFTDAYLLGTSGDELMSYERSNNRGEIVGEVVESWSLGSTKVRRGGRGGGRERLRTIHVAQTRVLLHKPVAEGDLLEVRPQSDFNQFLTTFAPCDANSGQTIDCKTKRAMENGSVVRVIRSKKAMGNGASAASLEVPRKRAVNVAIRAKKGRPFEVELRTVDGVGHAVAAGFVVEAARTRAVSETDLVEHVGRMGATPFEPVSFEVELDEGCGMRFSEVHEVRARACKTLEQRLLEPYERRSLPGAPSFEKLQRELDLQSASSLSADLQQSIELCALVSSPVMAAVARNAGATRIYASSDALEEGAWSGEVIPHLDEVCREGDHVRLAPWVAKGKPVAVGNVSELVLARKRGATPEIRGCIPVHNKSCVKALVDAGACGIWLSPELSMSEIEVLGASSPVPLGYVVYGRTRAMTCEHCVLQVADQCVDSCGHCSLRARKLFLRDDKGSLYPVQTDLRGRSRVYSSHSLDATPFVAELIQAGIRRLGIDCTLLSANETEDAILRVVRAIHSYRHGEQSVCGKQGQELNAGHLFSPIL